MAAATLDPEKTLSWEKRHRPRAAIASLVGALGLLVYYVAMERLRAGGPSISGLEALERGTAPGPVADLPSLRLAEFQYLHDQQRSDALDDYQESVDRAAEASAQVERRLGDRNLVTAGVDGLADSLKSPRLVA